MVLAPPSGPIRAGEEAVIRLFVHNYGARAVTVRLPDRLRYRLVSGGERAQGAMARKAPAADSVTVPPGGFVRGLYALTPPAALAGAATLEVLDLAADPVLLAVVRPAAVAAASGPPAEPPPAESIETRILRRFSGHEPMYFLVGVDPEDSKFQISFKFQPFDFEATEASRWHLLNGLHFAYTQTSFWDLASASKPFLDSSYKPEILYAQDDLRSFTLPGAFRWGMRLGFQHESNGKGGADSRSINIAYVRPRWLFGDPEGIHVELAPKVWSYVGSLDENPGIHRYRGYADLEVGLGKANGLWVSSTYRQGTDKASVQVDASYPLFDILPGKTAFYLYAQYFTGYGESLIGYNRKNEAIRFGLSVYR
jgi:outer membrane phospholipase A